LLKDFLRMRWPRHPCSLSVSLYKPPISSLLDTEPIPTAILTILRTQEQDKPSFTNESIRRCKCPEGRNATLLKLQSQSFALSNTGNVRDMILCVVRHNPPWWQSLPAAPKVLQEHFLAVCLRKAPIQSVQESDMSMDPTSSAIKGLFNH
jgi:hypothetical protein